MYRVELPSLNISWTASLDGAGSGTVDRVRVSPDGSLMASAIGFTGAAADSVLIRHASDGTGIDRMSPATQGRAVSVRWLPGDLDLVSAHSCVNELLA